ncbi:MAG: class I SAM-dependent methyltransferase [Bacteroidetes bacterium]|nr:class I SAM-dependent methyltransferase [Bacteroidota bacterium]
MKNGLPSLDLLDLLPGFNTEISPYTFLNGTSTTIDIAILKALASTYKDCSYMEIGTWRGESIANISDAAKECVSISLSDEEMRHMKFPEKMIGVQRFFSKEKKNIQYVTHNSKTFDFSSLNKKFDLIFVDGDHEYPAVKSDTANVFKLLKDDNSIIVWHDYGTAFETICWPVLAGILDGAPADKRKNIYHLSNTLCAIYTTKNLRTSKLEYPTVPNKNFRVRISAEKI